MSYVIVKNVHNFKYYLRLNQRCYSAVGRWVYDQSYFWEGLINNATEFEYANEAVSDILTSISNIEGFNLEIVKREI